ncbi:MAG TPA: isocitrate dehydrogenase kinase/phosphatase AceK regulatory subunit, partial [Longimicrobium sp.]|uniref:isocitrate dehydrogenase kinase/phosphatase AceK regulatory subunit n=1 Tax=Longimicrobium sp. TaxID=2029185 RepID=UPI002EDA44CA
MHTAPSATPADRAVPSPAPESADAIAREILAGYEGYLAAFLDVTRRAKGRFLRREWADGQRDASERLTLYSEHVARLVARVRGRLHAQDGAAEAEYKTRFAELAAGRPDADEARTFFNSAVRRALGISGVDPRVDFNSDPPRPLRGDGAALYTSLAAEGLNAAAFQALLGACEVAEAFADLPGDAALCAAAARAQMGEAADEVRCIDALPFLFYRN